MYYKKKRFSSNIISYFEAKEKIKTNLNIINFFMRLENLFSYLVKIKKKKNKNVLFIYISENFRIYKIIYINS